MVRRLFLLVLLAACGSGTPAPAPARRADVPRVTIPTGPTAAPTATAIAADPPKPRGPNVAARRIALGERIGCAVLVDGGLSCWGIDAGIEPTRVVGVVDATDVAVGDDVVVLRRDGTVSVFVDGGLAGAPIPLPLGRSATGIGACGPTICALDDARHVACWPDGIADPSDEGRNVVQLAAASRAVCVLDDAGVVRCWGQNQHSLLGVADTQWVERPTRVQGLPRLSRIPRAVRADLSSIGHVLTLDGHQAVAIALRHRGPDAPVRIADCDGARQIQRRGLALFDGGKVVRCSPSEPAVVLVEASPLVQLVDGDTPCGIDGKGAFGCVERGRLVTTFSGFTQVVASPTHACALDDGRVSCRGSNDAGECGVAIGTFRSELPRSLHLE